MNGNGGRQSSKGGGHEGQGGERWRGARSRRMAAVWDRIDSSAQALGEGMRPRGEGAQAREGGGDGQGGSRSCAAAFGQALERWAEEADRAFELAEALSRALFPAPVLPLLTLPSDCARKVVVGGIRSLRCLVE